MNKEKFIEKCEELGWWVSEYKDTFEIGKSSPAGEDFFFDVGSDNAVAEVRLYADNFDPEDHAVGWYKAGRGEPSSLRDLLDDADAIDQMLDDLATALENMEDEV